MMRESVAMGATQFSSDRMVREYFELLYDENAPLPEIAPPPHAAAPAPARGPAAEPPVAAEEDTPRMGRAS
jgi:hypothetical protein